MVARRGDPALHAHGANALRKIYPGYGPERFTYLPESNRYLCPAGEQLNYVGWNVRNRRPCLYRQRQALLGRAHIKRSARAGRYKYCHSHP